MPWCPKCKTEYIEGIEKCADCHTPLVASLEDAPAGTYSADEADAGMCHTRDGHTDEDKDAGRNGNDVDRNEKEENEDGGKAADVNEAEDHNGEDDPEDEDVLTPEELGRQLSRHTATYVRPEEKYQDTKSSGYMLTIIGAAGLIGLALIAAGVIPLSLDPVMQYVFYGVLIVFFGVFLIMGINALKKSGEYKSRISEEYARERSLMEWLMQDAQKQRLDGCRQSETSEEEAYFACQDMMKQMILEKVPDIHEEHMNYIIEKAYAKMYES